MSGPNSLVTRLLIFWRGLRQPAQLDADMQDEMRFHIEMETQRNIRERGLDPGEAARQAALAFGGVEKYRGAGRDALGFTWLRGLSLDLTLGVRMLGKYPGLTTVAILALSLAIGAGAGYLEFVNDLINGHLPFPEADRIVGILNWDQKTGEPDHRATFDFLRWRGSLTSVVDLGAARNVDRNLITEDGRAEPVSAVELSTSAFRLARVPPFLGRLLVPEDERPGSPPVALIGHDLWVTRFGSDDQVVGRTIRLGNAPFTVVGVMPEGFGFPVNQNLWVPLRLSDAAPARRDGAAIKIFGRLAPGATFEQAQAELNASAARAAIEFPDTHKYIRPVVKPYVESVFSGVQDSAMQITVFYSANLFFIGLLAVCGANVATLVFARTATREAEISVRTALGASRGRIAGQLFAEALVLSSIAAAVGMMGASSGLRWVKQTITAAENEPLMFWWNDNWSPASIVYAAVLAVGAAAIVGVMPALKATGPHVQDRLKHFMGAPSGRIRLGRTWTGVIVFQAALTVIFLAIAGTLTWGRYFDNAGNRPLTFPASQFVVARLSMDRDPEADAGARVDEQFRRRFGSSYTEFARRLRSETGVSDVTYATRLPGMDGYRMRIEMPGAASATDSQIPVRTTSVGADFFATFPHRMIAGRPLVESDLAAGRHVAVVDQTFVRRALNGQSAIGRQFREAAQNDEKPGPWIEIVGVVADLTADMNKEVGDALVYQPATAAAAYPIHVAVHAADPAAVMARLRTIAADADPALRLDDVQTLDQVSANDRIAIEFFAHLVSGISALALLLSTAGIYALMSFTVARRSSEIGIRVALGADPRRIVVSTFSRAFAQIGAGVLIGTLPACLIVLNLAPNVSIRPATEIATVVCAVVAGFMLIVTTLACAVPARRVLRIQPSDALRAT